MSELTNRALRQEMVDIARKMNASGINQGTAGNIPLAAAFTVVPIVIMGFYLWMAKRKGAFDAL